jgi:phage terminase large subunit-like protein
VTFAALDPQQIRELWPYLTDEERVEAERILGTLPPALTLRDYIRGAWPIVEPNTPYIHGWHIDAISELLTALTRLEINNAIVNIPPRHMKSLLVSVFWMTWTWTLEPFSRWIFGSYSDTLSIRDSLKCRNIITSTWYKQQWGTVYHLMPDQNQKARFENDQTGYRIATGVGGGATGEGAEYIVADDPLKALDADSEQAMQTANTWWDATMSSRMNDPKKLRKLVVMQRLNARDLTGHLLAGMRDKTGEHYETLILPAEYEQKYHPVPKPWHDRRTEPGALLWPERFDRPALAKLKQGLRTELAIAGQLQQRPSPPGGAIYRADWWAGERNRYRVNDPAQIVTARWLSLDTALKDKDANDFSVCLVVELLADYRMRLRHMWKEHLTFPSLVRDIAATAEAWFGAGQGPNGVDLLRGVIIEDTVSGTSAIQTLRESAPAWLAPLIIDFAPGGSKVYRARQASVWCELDCVLLPYPSPEVPWLYGWEADRDDFPRGEHDDTIDPFSQAIIYLEHLLAAGWHGREAAKGKAA